MAERQPTLMDSKDVVSDRTSSAGSFAPRKLIKSELAFGPPVAAPVPPTALMLLAAPKLRSRAMFPPKPSAETPPKLLLRAAAEAACPSPEADGPVAAPAPVPEAGVGPKENVEARGFSPRFPPNDAFRSKLIESGFLFPDAAVASLSAMKAKREVDCETSIDGNGSEEETTNSIAPTFHLWPSDRHERSFHLLFRMGRMRVGWGV